jgi:hypothetical protein
MRLPSATAAASPSGTTATATATPSRNVSRQRRALKEHPAVSSAVIASPIATMARQAGEPAL